jgi:hypothetical protein
MPSGTANVNERELSMRRKVITSVVVVLFCALAFGYSNGWFSSASDNLDTGSSSVSADGAISGANVADEVVNAAKID